MALLQRNTKALQRSFLQDGFLNDLYYIIFFCKMQIFFVLHLSYCKRICYNVKFYERAETRKIAVGTKFLSL